MAIRDPKNRTISFRLSEQEYTVAEQLCRQQRFRSMSVFARCALLAYGNRTSECDITDLEGMRQRVDDVMRQIAGLTKRLKDGKEAFDLEL